MDDTPQSPSPAKEPAGTDAVAAILEALGGHPVLLPIEPGQKGPRWTGWQKLTWDQTQDPGHEVLWQRARRDSTDQVVKDAEGHEVMEVYRRVRYAEAIRAGNIGVLLGEPSRLKDDAGGRYVLCSIDIDADEAIEPFLALNSWAADTLRTHARRGCNFWVWVEASDYPRGVRKLYHVDENGKEDKARAWGEWRADGGQTVIYGVHPAGMRYERIGAARSPRRCTFGEIVWPEDVFAPWRKTAYDKLVDLHGPPWTDSKKALTLNPPFFVGKYALEHQTLFEPDEGEFYQYDASRGLWEKVSDDRIRWDVSMDFKKLGDRAKALDPEFHLDRLLQKRTNRQMADIVSLLRGAVERRRAFDREAGLIHLKNCVLDLRTDPPTVHSFRADFFSRNQVPVDLVEGADCPRFLQELVLSAVSAEDADLMQRWAGSLLLGVNLGQRFLILTGRAGGGKSTFLNLMQKMIGEVNCTQLRTKHLEERFEVFSYVGKTFLVGPDVPGDFMQAEGAYMIKALVGGDLLSAERKNGDVVQIRGTFNLGISCNSRLRVRLDGDADAWRRRLGIIVYDRPAPTKPDPQFLDRVFQSEAAGVLNWMIAGARKLLAEFREVGGYKLARAHLDRVDSLLAESDSVRHFVRHGVAPAEGETCTMSELADAYTLYCEGKGWRAESYKRVQNTLVDAIQEVHRLTPRHDIKRRDHGSGAEKSQRGYRGLRVLPGDRQLEPQDAHEPEPVGAALGEGPSEGLF